MSKFSLIISELNELASKNAQLKFELSESGAFLICSGLKANCEILAIKIPTGYGYGLELQSIYFGFNESEKRNIKLFIPSAPPFAIKTGNQPSKIYWGRIFLTEMRRICENYSIDFFPIDSLTLINTFQVGFQIVEALHTSAPKVIDALQEHLLLKEREEELKREEEFIEYSFAKKEFVREIPFC